MTNYLVADIFHPVLCFCCRGFVQCLKLSPNLRKQTKEVKAALLNKDSKKALEFEIKKLETLLAMVREPDEKDKKATKKDEESDEP